MKRRVFLSTLAWGAATLFVRPLSAMPPPFHMVRRRISNRVSARPTAEIAVTSMGKSIATWKGQLEKKLEKPLEIDSEEHGALRLSPDSPSPGGPGFKLLSCMLAQDPLKQIEKAFGGIRHARNRVESHQERSLAYRYGDSPSLLVERESWLLLEVDIGKQAGHGWIAHLTYKPDATNPHMIRITQDNRPSITARLTY